MIDKQRITQRARRIRPLLFPLILYIGLLAAAVTWAPSMQPSIWRYLVALLPMIPGLFLAFGIVKASSQLDEMENRIILEAVTFSFTLTLIFLLSYSLLSLVGVPQPRTINIVFMMCILLIIGKFWGNWRYR